MSGTDPASFAWVAVNVLPAVLEEYCQYKCIDLAPPKLFGPSTYPPSIQHLSVHLPSYTLHPKP